MGEIRVIRILLDTNVVLDVLLKREPWVSDASVIWQANDEGRLVGYLMASALTDIFYIACRLAGRRSCPCRSPNLPRRL